MASLDAFPALLRRPCSHRLHATGQTATLDKLFISGRKWKLCHIPKGSGLCAHGIRCPEADKGDRAYPTQPFPSSVRPKAPNRIVALVLCGLIPYYAKDASMG